MSAAQSDWVPRLEFFVPGVPVSQGSKRHVGNGRMIESSARLRPWRDTVSWHANEVGQRKGWTPPASVAADLRFVFTRPKTVTPAKRPVPSVKPDLDKLVRAIFDALTDAGLITDDAQIVELSANKSYGDKPGVHIGLYDALDTPRRTA